jgi:ribosomal protein S5
MPRVLKKLDAGSYQLKDQVVSINRVTKVVKGGKNMSFAALVVVGEAADLAVISLSVRLAMTTASSASLAG